MTSTPIERNQNGHGRVLALAPAPNEPPQKMTITRVYLWPVARLAIVVWCAVGAAILLTVGAVLTLLSGSGTIGRFEEFITDLTGLENFRVMSDAVLGTIAIAVAIMVVCAIAFTVLAAAFFNAYASIFGGIDLGCAEHPIAPLRREPDQSNATRSRGP
jgi:hypothetical protein